MKSLSLSCVLLACALFASSQSQAQSYTEQARQRAEHARAVAELLVLEQKITGLQTEIDSLNRKEAGAPRKEQIFPEIAELEKERDDIRKALVSIESLQSRLVQDAENTRKSYFELKGYVQRLERLQTQNVLKTIMSLAMEVAQEIQSVVGVSGKPVEFAKWAAEKAADPVVKGIVSYGGPEYYTRKMQGLSERAAATTPEMQRLKDLSGLSLEGWRSYMLKHESKEIEGNTGLILGKVRVLLEQANKAMWSLVDLYNALDREAKSFAVDMGNMRDRLKEIELRLAELKKKEEDLQSPERKANQEQQKLLSARLAPLQQQRNALKQKISELEIKLGQLTNTPENTGPEQKMASYKNLRNKLISEIPSFAAQAGRVESGLTPLEELLVKRKSMRERQEKEIEKVISKANETAMYPYSGDKDDLEALDNLRRYQDEWYKAHDRHLVEQRALLSEIDSAVASLERTFNTTPHDYLSEVILRNAVAKAGDDAHSAIREELYRLENAPPGQGRRGQMEALKVELEQLLAQPLLESPYARSAGFKFDQGETSNPLYSLVAEVLARIKWEVESGRQWHQRQGLELEGQKQEQEKTLTQATKEIEARRTGYEAAAREFLAAGPDYLKLLEEASVARDAYFSDLKSLANSGVLEKTGESSYRLNPAYIEKTLGSTPRTCQGIDRLREQLSSLADRSAAKLDAAQGASRSMNSTGMPGAPNSEWSRINKPALHQQVQALDNKIQAELNKISQAPPFLPGSNALISFVNSITTNDASLIITLPDFFNKMQQTLRESDAMSKAALQEAENMVGQERVHADSLKRLQEWYKRLLDTHEKDFGCFDPEHVFNQAILDRLKQLKKILEKLEGKPQYASAGNLLSTLNALKTQVSNLSIGEGDAYRQEVDRLRGSVDGARKNYESSKKSLDDSDAAQVRQLLEELEERLSEHETAARGNAAHAKFAAVSNEQVQKLYQDFITAYGQGNHRALIALLDDGWSGGDGADVRDAEDALVNSFKVFERIQYRVSSFNVQPLADGTVQVSYQLKIVGQNRRQNLEHVEESAVVEIVGLVDGKPRILRTLSGNQWIR